jgi:hypothetical protein
MAPSGKVFISTYAKPDFTTYHNTYHHDEHLVFLASDFNVNDGVRGGTSIGHIELGRTSNHPGLIMDAVAGGSGADVFGVKLLPIGYRIIAARCEVSCMADAPAWGQGNSDLKVFTHNLRTPTLDSIEYQSAAGSIDNGDWNGGGVNTSHSLDTNVPSAVGDGDIQVAVRLHLDAAQQLTSSTLLTGIKVPIEKT